MAGYESWKASNTQCNVNYRGSAPGMEVERALFIQGTLNIEGRTTHKFVYTGLLKFLLYSRAIQIDPCCSVQALYR